MQVLETSYSLPAGDPYCAPETTAIVEANIKILQNLVGVDGWAHTLNEIVRERLRQTRGLVNMISPDDNSHDGVYSTMFISISHQYYLLVVSIFSHATIKPLTYQPTTCWHASHALYALNGGGRQFKSYFIKYNVFLI